MDLTLRQWVHISFIYVGILLLAFILREAGLSFINPTHANLFQLLLFPAFLFPAIWIALIRRGWLKFTLYGAYALAMVMALPVLFFLFVWSWNDIQSGNGYRRVYEKKVDEGLLVVYRTPDQGALGGDHLEADFVRSLGLGFEWRRVLDAPMPIDIPALDSSTVSHDGKSYMLPGTRALYANGDLNGGP